MARHAKAKPLCTGIPVALRFEPGADVGQMVRTVRADPALLAALTEQQQNTSGKGGSGLFNSYPIPFSTNITVTMEMAGTPGHLVIFWIVLRGRTQAVLTMPGTPSVVLPLRRNDHWRESGDMATGARTGRAG